MFVRLQEKISSSESDNQPSLVEDSPASHTALQENAKHLVMNVILQENSKESFGRLNPDGSLLRMSQGYAQANLDGFLESSCMTFPRWGILSGGVVGELPMLEPAIEENGFLLLPTCRSRESGNYQYANGDHEKPVLTLSGKIAEILPTLTSCDATMGQLKGKEYTGNRHALKLEQAINLLPTPTSRDYKDCGNMGNVPVNALLGRELGKNHGLKLQPAFAEWMMGFSPEWTALNALEMQLFRNKSIRSSKRSQTLKERG
jgi:hypothetical protein